MQAAESSARAGLAARLRAWLGERPDERILLLVLRAMLAGTVAVLAIDLYQMHVSAPAGPPALSAPGETDAPAPYLPPADPSREGATPPAGLPGRADPALREPMTIELVEGRRLNLTGAITPGTAERLATEVRRRGAYVETVVLNSPGGSVTDALAMARLIRERGYATEVPDGAYCASSCPLVLAGGLARRAHDRAAIGVHQIFALTATAETYASGLDRAQRISAECQRLLVDMGVDPRVWIHAMETPRESLFYFTPGRLAELNLTTEPAAGR